MADNKTGHGKNYCGKYKCKGGCEGQSKPKSPMVKSFESRPTAQEYNDPIKNELAEMIGINEGLKQKALGLYEKLRSANQLTTSVSHVSKDEMKEALLLSGYREESKGVFSNLEPVENPIYHREAGEVFDLNKMTYNRYCASHDPQTDCYTDSRFKGKDLLWLVASELEKSVTKDLKSYDPNIQKHFSRVDEKVNDYANKIKEENRKSKFSDLDDDTYLGPTKLWDCLRAEAKTNPNMKEITLKYGYKGYSITDDCYLISGTNGDPKMSAPGKPTDKNALSVWIKDPDRQGYLKRVGNFRQTKGNLEKALKATTKEELIKLVPQKGGSNE